jgi:hypothetical protein
MSDICLCSGNTCTLKLDCYRYTAEILGRQDFFGSPPFKDGICEFFLDNSQQIKLLAYYLWLERGSQKENQENFWFAAKEQLYQKNS